MSNRRTPTLLWLRRDLRLDDHPAWARALAGGGPVIPVFVLDPEIEGHYGAAPRWRLGEALACYGKALSERGSRLVLRRGAALEALRALVSETGATRIVWTRQYEPRAIERDRMVKASLKDDGVEAVSTGGSVLFEPWEVATGQGGFYKVYTPFWNAVRQRDPGTPLSAPGDLAPPETWPASDRLADWALGAAMNRGADIVARHACIGETAARDRFEAFRKRAIARYGADRDRMDLDATSTMSEPLAYGEVSPRRLWALGWTDAERCTGKAADSAEKFVAEVVWREFAYHLLYHTPELATGNWRTEWNAFPWRRDNRDAERWRRGRTGIEIVDAAMREMYVTGRMHNRARMIVASVLTKHLMTHWRVGERWFADCLTDWDPASNAMGWQWSAGSGPDATPYFRVFNPATQAEKFDPQRAYRDRWLAEGRASPHADALSYFDAVPRSWGLSPDDDAPPPIVGLKEGRERALAAYSGFKS